MSKKCRAYSESKLGLELPDNRKAFYAGWDAALRAALAEPEQDGICKHCTDGCPACDARKQRKPLTDEKIKECERQAMVNGALPFEQRAFFARAIERAQEDQGE